MVRWLLDASALYGRHMGAGSLGKSTSWLAMDAGPLDQAPSSLAKRSPADYDCRRGFAAHRPETWDPQNKNIPGCNIFAHPDTDKQ